MLKIIICLIFSVIGVLCVFSTISKGKDIEENDIMSDETDEHESMFI